MTTNGDSQWWTKEHESGWERVKAAMRRDWDQTKHDFGGDEPDTNQDVDDTAAQALGKQPIPPRGAATYEDVEPAYRFGYGARRHYGEQFTDWNSEVETKLRNDWQMRSANADSGEGLEWGRIRPVVRRGWEFEAPAQHASSQRRQ